MANYEFPSSDKSTTTSATIQSNKNPTAGDAPLTNAEAKKHIESVKRAIKEKEEKEEKEREKRRQERKEKIDKIWKDVKGGLSNVTDKVSDLGEDVSSNITQEVFGSGFYANQMNNLFGKTIRKISESLKWIGSTISSAFSKMWHFMVDAVKKFRKIFSRNGLFGTIFIYFRWMKQKLTAGFSKLWKMLESLKLFNILGSLISGVGSAIKGTLNVGGDLIKSLASWIMGSAAGKMLTSGISHLGDLLKKLSLRNIITSIGEFLASLVPKSIAGPLTAVIGALWPTAAGDKADDAYYTAQTSGAIPKSMTLEEFKESYGKSKDTTKQEALNEAEYNRLLKEYPIIAKEQFKKRWLIDADRDDNGLQDYTADRLAKFRNILNASNNQMMINDYGLSKEAVEELKNKSTLKNVAGVSST